MHYPKPSKKEKQKRSRSENFEYMKWVTTQACCVPSCGAVPTQAHHAVHKSALGGDETCVPLCFMCHSLYHMKYGSAKSFEKAFGIDLIAEAKRLYKLFKI